MPLSPRALVLMTSWESCSCERGGSPIRADPPASDLLEREDGCSGCKGPGTATRRSVPHPAGMAKSGTFSSEERVLSFISLVALPGNSFPFLSAA